MSIPYSALLRISSPMHKTTKLGFFIPIHSFFIVRLTFGPPTSVSLLNGFFISFQLKLLGSFQTLFITILLSKNLYNYQYA